MDEPEPKIEDFFKCKDCSKAAKRPVLVDKALARRVEKNFLSAAAGWKCPQGHFTADEE